MVNNHRLCKRKPIAMTSSTLQMISYSGVIANYLLTACLTKFQDISKTFSRTITHRVPEEKKHSVCACDIYMYIYIIIK